MRISGDRRRQDARRRIVAAMRMSALLEGPDAPLTLDRIGESIDLPSRAVHGLFRDADDLLDELNEQLVEEAALRLGSVEAAVTTAAGADPEQSVRALVDAVVRARPLERSGLIVRIERRRRALRQPGPRPSIRNAEGRFPAVLSGEIARLLAISGREPVTSVDVSRVLLNCYERAFEAWLADGHDEADFAGSPFACETLPCLVLALSTSDVLPAEAVAAATVGPVGTS